MANQIVVSAGAKVRNLDGVLTGTSGVVNSLPINAANGIPQLDVNGKILVSQLPNSVMEYKGTWNAATNTPTLVNGTGNQGDVYLCNVAGTVNFGAGPIAFFVGDQVIYSGSIWQRASGATGTVTSVAVTESGDSLNITGSPITTSGTINIGFNGTNLQYVNGAGNLTTFPTLITSIGLSMPSAFSVANSPLTANGTIAVTGAGVASQYIRGDGTLASFPTGGGGGSSVSYYLNGGTNQGTFVGNTYYEMSKNAVIGTGVDFTINANGYISQFITDANDPAQLVIPAGNWNFEMYFSASSGGGSPSFYVELYKYNGSTFTLIADNSANPEYITNGTAIDLYTTAVAVPETSLTITDRLAIRVYVLHASKTITLHTQNSHLCEVITTFSTGITALNGLTAQVQYFQVGTSGTDFNISSATATHTFNIPDASATARGLITTGTQTIAGTKTFSDATKNNGGIFLQNGSSSSLAGYMNLGGLTNGVKFTSGGGISNSFTLPSATGYTFTFPNATGTLALTTDLGAYLPLAGGIMTGQIVLKESSSSADYTKGLRFPNDPFGGSDDIAGMRLYNSSGENMVLELYTGNDGANDIINFATGVNGTPSNDAVTINGNKIWNAGNLTPQTQLNGTGFVKASGTTISYDNSTYYLASNPSSFIALTALSFTAGSGAYNSTTGVITIPTNNNQITNGAGYITSSALSGYLPLTGGTLTGALNINLSSGDALNVAGNAIFRGDTGVATPRQLIISSGGSTPVYLSAKGYGANYQTDFGIRTFNSVGTSFEVFYATSSGLVGINQTSPSYLLDVNGTFGATSAFLSSYIRTDGSTGFKNTSSGGTAPSSLASYSQLFFDSYELKVRKADGQINTFRYPSVASTQTWDFNVEGYLTAQSTASLTTGSVMFANSVGKITQDNSNFFWDDTNNRLGIGTASPDYPLSIQTDTAANSLKILARSGGDTSISWNSLNNATQYAHIDIGASYFQIFASNSQAMQFYTGGSARLTIASTGAATLQTTGNNGIINIGGSTYYSQIETNSTLGGLKIKSIWGGANSGIIQFINGTSENVRMHIADNGNVLIGTTTDSGYHLQVDGSSGTYGLQILQGGNANSLPMEINHIVTSGNNKFIQFVTDSTARGLIYFDRTTTLTVYSTTSDYRLKTELEDFNGLDIVKKLNPKKFRIDKAENKSIGFIAHELQEYFPQAVGGEKDAIDENGIPIYQTVDYSQLTGLLVKAIQEQQLQIEELKLKIK